MFDPVMLRSVNFASHFIRHRDFLGELTPQRTNEPRDDFFFRLVPGLARGDLRDEDPASLVSIRSTNFPTHFLRHQDFRLKLQQPAGPGDRLFRLDATFFLEEPGLAGEGLSFRSVNFPDRYLCHRDFHLFVEPRDSANLTRDATFNRSVPID
jgi:Alpha-L-arabinofuranosidase B (ABFB) domain